jgi:hypothetical protein
MGTRLWASSCTGPQAWEAWALTPVKLRVDMGQPDSHCRVRQAYVAAATALGWCGTAGAAAVTNRPTHHVLTVLDQPQSSHPPVVGAVELERPTRDMAPPLATLSVSATRCIPFPAPSSRLAFHATAPSSLRRLPRFAARSSGGGGTRPEPGNLLHL